MGTLHEEQRHPEHEASNVRMCHKTKIDDWRGGGLKNMNNLQKNRSRLQKTNINLK
jgi:hypothetical protein